MVSGEWSVGSGECGVGSVEWSVEWSVGSWESFRPVSGNAQDKIQYSISKQKCNANFTLLGDEGDVVVFCELLGVRVGFAEDDDFVAL